MRLKQWITSPDLPVVIAIYISQVLAYGNLAELSTKCGEGGEEAVGRPPGVDRVVLISFKMSDLLRAYLTLKSKSFRLSWMTWLGGVKWLQSYLSACLAALVSY
jgi:hypothetical protein